MPDLPRFQDWPDDVGPRLPREVQSLYSQGYQGIIEDPEEAQRLDNVTAYTTWADAAPEFGTAGTGRGGLYRPWLCATKHAPEIWPGPPQTRGDCVSRSTAAAGAGPMCAEIEAGEPDEVTGLGEHYEPVPFPEEGVIASEVIYGARGHSGEGASCDRLARFVSVEGGIMLRKEYELEGYGSLDLRKYDADIGFHMPPPLPPRVICDEAGSHRVRDVTRIEDVEQARDALANGYGISCCSNYGFGNRRDRFGVARRSGHWMHAMAWIGVNDDPDDPACLVHGHPLFLVLNSWGRNWIKGDRYHDQPAGSFWITPRVARGMLARGGAFAFSSVDGFPRKELPDYGATDVI